MSISSTMFLVIFSWFSNTTNCKSNLGGGLNVQETTLQREAPPCTMMLLQEGSFDNFFEGALPQLLTSPSLLGKHSFGTAMARRCAYAEQKQSKIQEKRNIFLEC
eukprot:EG_transcript_20180